MTGETLPRELTDAEITSCVEQIFATRSNPKIGDFLVTHGSITDASEQKLNAKLREHRYDGVVSLPPEVVASDPEPEHEDEDDEMLPGAIETPDGYRLIGEITEGRMDGVQRFPQTNLLTKHATLEVPSGVSLSLDRVPADQTHGTLLGRIIYDQGGRAYIFRRDDDDSGTTFFKVSFSHQGLAAE